MAATLEEMTALVLELRERLAVVEQSNVTSAGGDATNVNEMAAAVANAVRAAPAAAPMPGPPTYIGENDSVEFSTFIELLERNMELNGWNRWESAQRARLLLSCLKGQAVTAFHALTDAQKNDYDLAKGALSTIFVNPAKTTLYQNLFDERSQRKGESLETLVTELKKLAKRAYPEVRDPKFIDTLVNRRFAEAIHDEQLRDTVRMWRCDTIDQTLIQALKFEAALQKQRTKTTRVASINSIQHDDVENSNRYGNNFAGNNGNGQSGRGGYSGGRGGFVGNQSGRGGNSGGRGGYSGPSTNGQPENRYCYTCGIQGHLSYNCPNRPKA